MSAGPDDALLGEVRQISQEVAATHAADVDRAARFPSETLAALREVGALSALVPVDLGGQGASLPAVASACFELARQCGASGMVFAMHQIQVATLARHARGRPWFEAYLADVAAGQRLIGSVTSEVGTGGDMGRSIAAVEPGPDGTCRFEKQAPTVSYGEHADDLLTTLRRAPGAESGDQVLALTVRGQARLEQQSTWDPLGMRGTCSPGFVVRAELTCPQVLDEPFSRVSAETMVPVAHILWSHVWLGLATDAFDRARAFVRAAARQRPGAVPPSARRLSGLMTHLSLMRAEVSSALGYFVEHDPGEMNTMAAAVRFNNLKIAASEQAPEICLGALSVCGIAGYRNDPPFSVGRHVRDALSAPLMVANERIHDSNASLLLIAKDI